MTDIASSADTTMPLDRPSVGLERVGVVETTATHDFASFVGRVRGVAERAEPRDVLAAAFDVFAEQHPWRWGTEEARIASRIVSDALGESSPERQEEIQSLVMFAACTSPEPQRR